jgi:hypothetical protein
MRLATTISNIFQFTRAVVRHWGALVSGGALIGFLGIWSGTGHQVPPFVYWIVAVIGIFVACYQAWNEERIAKEKAVADKAVADLELAKAHEATVSAHNAKTSDSWLSLLHSRQKLEEKLRPLLEIEESGVKVVPQIKIGKDESDHRREQIVRLKRDIEDISKRLTTKGETAVGGSQRDWAGDWKELSGRFEPLAKSGIRADSCKRLDCETWSIAGGDRTASGRLATLCKHAGELLSKSPNASRGVPAAILAIPDAADRWFSYLKYAKPINFKSNGYGTEELNDAGEKQTPIHIFLGTIDELPLASANVCLECAAKEY